MPRLLALALVTTLPFATPAAAVAIKDCPSLSHSLPACAIMKKALESKEQIELSAGDVVTIDDAGYTVIDTKYGPILRHGDTIFVLPQLENGAYMRVDDMIVLVNAQTDDVVELIRAAHLIVS